MKKTILLVFILFLVSKICIGQDDKYVHKNLPSHFLETRQIIGEDNIKHIDSLAGYKVIIPQWWNIRESSTRNILSGILPKTKEIANAIAFKFNLKGGFTDLNEFKNIVITGYKTGDSMKWSNEHTLLKMEMLDDFEKIGSAYYVELEWRNRTYCCCYILAETSNTFLWIDFTATKETYDINFPKFKELINTVTLI